MNIRIVKYIFSRACCRGTPKRLRKNIFYNSFFRNSVEGYSLIEIMVVFTIFAILMLVATQTLLLSLRGANKSEAVTKVKENVELAVGVMERQIRSAKAVSGCSSATPTTLSFINADGVNSDFTCNDVGANGYISTGGSRITNQNISIIGCSLICTENIGAPETVTISITAQDNSQLSSVERARAESRTTVQLRQY